MTAVAVSPYLSVWTVVSLRPASQQAAMRRAIKARGATPLLLAAMKLAPASDTAQAKRALRDALDCERVIFTSPAAVEFAQRLQPLAMRRDQTAIAVGDGTARALARLGIEAVAPRAGSMHSEGVLALDEVVAARGPIGVVTAPDGRGAIVATLRERGMDVRVAEVYRRLPASWNRRHFEAIANSRRPRAVLVTSAEALRYALAALPESIRTILLDAVAITSSERLAEATRAAGFAGTLVAASPGVDALLDALAAHAKAESIR
jgi:uroporphyrinogen-III synthase